MSVIAAPEPLSGTKAPASDVQLEWWRLAIRHRRRLAILWICVAVVSGIVSLLLPPTYTATTRLMPPQQNQSLASMFMGQLASSPLISMAQKDLGLKNPADIYVGILTSRSIQDGLIRDFDLGRVYRLARPSSIRKKLAHRTRVQLTKEGLLAVSVEDRDPQRAAALANGYAEELRRTTNRVAMSEAGQRRQFFDDQVQQSKDDLAHAELVLSAVQQKTGILEVDAQAKALIETSTRLRGQIAAGEVQLRALRSFGTEKNPDVRQQEAQLAGWRSELARLESQQSGDPAFSKGRAPEQGQEYVRAMREVKYRDAVLEMLLRQLEAAKLDEAKEGAIIQVVDVAVPPDTRTSPKRTAIVLLTLLIVVPGSIFLLFIFEKLRTESKWQSRWANLRSEWRS